MKTKLVCIFVVMLLIFAVLSVRGAINVYNIPKSKEEVKLLDDNWKFNNLVNLEPINVLIELNTTGISYGHELLWKARTTGTNYEESAVTYIDGIAYIGSCSTHGEGYDSLFAVDTTNGEILWSKITGPGYVGPVIDDDVIYIGTDSHGLDPSHEYVYAINRFTGEEIWQRKIYGGIPESIQFDDDKIYFCSDTIYALNKIDGSVNWTYNMGSICVTKPMLKDNVLYAASYGRKLAKVDTTDGSRIWSITLSAGPWDNSITTDSKGHIFLAIYYDRTINSYDEDDGTLIWSYRLHGGPLSFNAYHNGVIFISDTSGYVYALNSTSGTLIWENKIGNTIDISSPTLSGGLLFIGTRDNSEGAFFALNETTGDILWKYTIGSSITAPPSIADGIMLCGTDDWYMYAFDFGIGTGNWILHRYDSFNTAYSPDGLISWQNVRANCTTDIDITTCTITNYYDHDVSNIILELKDNFSAYWYNSLGELLKSESDSYTIENLSISSSLTFIISKNPISYPNKPTKPNGPTSGRIDIEYTYTTSSTDPDGDNIYYLFDWDDGKYSGWIGPYTSGETAETSHIWTEKRDYNIKVKAKDVYGLESEWSDPLAISMPKNKPYFDTPFYHFLQKNPYLFQLFLQLQ